MNLEKVWRGLRILAAILAVYLLAVLTARTVAKMNKPSPHPLYGIGAVLPAGNRVLNIAHQGGNLEAPDETAEAFRNGLDSGADMLELDLHLSADGHLIVIHDSRVDRTTNGRGAIAEMTLDEIKDLDAAYWWPYHSRKDLEKRDVPVNQDFPWRGQGLEQLTFAELLAAHPQVPMIVEIKSGGSSAALAVYERLKDFDRLDNVLVVSANPEILSAYRDLSPESPTGADRSEVIRFWLLGKLGLSGFAGLDATAMQVPVSQGRLKVVTRGFIRRAHRLGLAVHVWTINDEEEMARLIQMGVDGIITDRPSLLAELQ